MYTSSTQPGKVCDDRYSVCDTAAGVSRIHFINNIQYNCSHNRKKDVRYCIGGVGTDYIYTTQKEDNISNNIEKVHIINDGGGEGVGVTPSR